MARWVNPKDLEQEFAAFRVIPPQGTRDFDEQGNYVPVPRIPSNGMGAIQGEDETTPRICAGPDVESCLRAIDSDYKAHPSDLYARKHGWKVYGLRKLPLDVHKPAEMSLGSLKPFYKPNKDTIDMAGWWKSKHGKDYWDHRDTARKDAVERTKGIVADASKSKEIWLRQPTRMEYIGTIHHPDRANGIRLPGVKYEDRFGIMRPDDDTQKSEQAEVYADLYLSKMAIQDIRPGSPTQDFRGRPYHDYSHLLTPKQRRELGPSVSIRVFTNKNPLGETDLVAKLWDSDSSNANLGTVEGRATKPDDDIQPFEIDYAKLRETTPRRLALGRTLYEAAMAHAKHVLNCTHVRGKEHSTLASRAHEAIAAKHGLNYKPLPNVKGMPWAGENAWKDKDTWDEGGQQEPEWQAFDDRFAGYQYTLKSEQPLQKSFSNMAVGPKVSETPFEHEYDYSHLLSDEARDSGYAVRVKHSTNNSLGAHLFYNGENVGEISGGLRQGKKGSVLDIGNAEIYVDHRGKKLGVPMYEAIIRHAAEVGATHVTGDYHSTMAMHAHRALAQKHGLSYVPKLSEGAETWSTGPYDGRFDPYQYTIKSELPLAKDEAAGTDPIMEQLDHPDWRERQLALKHVDVQERHIHKALHDDDEDVRNSAIGHPLFTPELAQKLPKEWYKLNLLRVSQQAPWWDTNPEIGQSIVNDVWDVWKAGAHSENELERIGWQSKTVRLMRQISRLSNNPRVLTEMYDTVHTKRVPGSSDDTEIPIGYPGEILAAVADRAEDYPEVAKHILMNCDGDLSPSAVGRLFSKAPLSEDELKGLIDQRDSWDERVFDVRAWAKSPALKGELLTQVLRDQVAQNRPYDVECVIAKCPNVTRDHLLEVANNPELESEELASALLNHPAADKDIARGLLNSKSHHARAAAYEIGKLDEQDLIHAIGKEKSGEALMELVQHRNEVLSEPVLRALYNRVPSLKTKQDSTKISLLRRRGLPEDILTDLATDPKIMGTVAWDNAMYYAPDSVRSRVLDVIRQKPELAEDLRHSGIVPLFTRAVEEPGAASPLFTNEPDARSPVSPDVVGVGLDIPKLLPEIVDQVHNGLTSEQIDKIAKTPGTPSEVLTGLAAFHDKNMSPETWKYLADLKPGVTIRRENAVCSHRNGERNVNNCPDCGPDGMTTKKIPIKTGDSPFTEGEISNIRGTLARYTENPERLKYLAAQEPSIGTKTMGYILENEHTPSDLLHDSAVRFMNNTFGEDEGDTVDNILRNKNLTDEHIRSLVSHPFLAGDPGNDVRVDEMRNALIKNPNVTSNHAATMLSKWSNLSPQHKGMILNRDLAPQEWMEKEYADIGNRVNELDRQAKEALAATGAGEDTREYENVLDRLERLKEYQGKLGSVLARHSPDTVHKSFVMVKPGSQRFRWLRNQMESAGVDQLALNQLPPGNWDMLRKGGQKFVTLDAVNKYIDKMPACRYNISMGEWAGCQTHNHTPSTVFQVNVSNDHVRKLKEAGVYDTFKNIQGHIIGSHPITPTTMGWVRFTHPFGDDPNNPSDGKRLRGQQVSGSDRRDAHLHTITPEQAPDADALHLDEIQSDHRRTMADVAYAHAFSYEEDKQAAENAYDQMAQQFPPEHQKKINKIVFGKEDPHEVLLEAFHQFWRDRGFHKLNLRLNGVGMRQSLTGQENAEQMRLQGEGEDAIAKVKPPSIHTVETYDKLPKKMMMTPESSYYGDHALEDNDEFKGLKMTTGQVLKHEDLAKMAIKDIPKGRQADAFQTEWDYSHVLSPEQRAAGYSLRVQHTTPGKKDWIDMAADLYHEGHPVGSVVSLVDGNKLEISLADIEDHHTGKGLGPVMYEALAAHAKHHFGATHITGEAHSTLAMKAHKKLAEKHGLSYEPQPNVPSHDWKDMEKWGAAKPKPYDARFAPYAYTIKSEIPLSKAISKIPVGKLIGRTSRNSRDWRQAKHDYSHLLHPIQRRNGFRLYLTHTHFNGRDEVGNLTATVIHTKRNNKEVSRVDGHVYPDGRLAIELAETDPGFRGRKLGLRCYEAVMAHAKNKLGATRVVGGTHSSMAHGAHKKISALHGMNYTASPDYNAIDAHPSLLGPPYRNKDVEALWDNPGAAWRSMKPAPFDERYSEYDYTLKSEGPSEFAKMAIQDIRRGAFTGKWHDVKGQTYNYTHVLPNEHQKNLQVLVHSKPLGPDPRGARFEVNLKENGNDKGWVIGFYNPQTNAVKVGLAELAPEHRGKGIGTALYEALYAHAKHYHGATHAVGAEHSTMAHKAHLRLAAKHGLNYAADLNPEAANNRPGEYDDKWGGYKYTL